MISYFAEEFIYLFMKATSIKVIDDEDGLSS